MNNVKYDPQNTNTERIEIVNGINRYVPSGYNRTEISHFVKDEYRFVKNKKFIMIVLEHKCIKVIKMKNNKYTTVINDHFDTEELHEMTQTNYQKILGRFDISIKRSLANASVDNLQNTFVWLVLRDVFGRSCVLGMVDVFINILNVKGIHVIPHSLGISFGSKHSNAIIIDVYDHHTNVFIVDDYFVYDHFVINNTWDERSLSENATNNNEEQEAKDIHTKRCNIILADDEDYREEWQKTRLTRDVMYYSCVLCEFINIDEEKVFDHLKMFHTYEEDNLQKMILKYKNMHGDIVTEIMSRMRFIYNVDKLKKTSTKLICNDKRTSVITKSTRCNDLAEQLRFLYSDVAVVERDDDDQLLIAGIELFSNLDVSKDSWMTDVEWRNGRLRILKDKVLFNI